VLQEAVDDAGPVEPGGDGKPPRHGGGLEPADLLHPPDVELQLRAPCGQRVQAVPGAPGEVAAQVRCGVLSGGALEAGQVGSHCQPQLISERHEMIGGDWGQFGVVHHDLTLRLLPMTAKMARHAPDAA
jgi:hypothetical protein